MSKYSDRLNSSTLSIDPMDDDYEDKLRDVAKCFRGFNDALTAFIVDHGYNGNSDDAVKKTQFIRDKFKVAGIKVPRSINKWFSSCDWMSRDTAFKICFAFNLNINDTNDFFRRVQFERSFDCHTVAEAVYYFCIRNGLNFKAAQTIINTIKENIDFKKSSKLPDTDILYTKAIMNEIDKFNDENELIDYIQSNIENFTYNNATAINYIQDLWKEISGPDGIAVKEGKLISQELNLAEGYADQPTFNKFSDDNLIVSDKDASSWTIYSQILGLDKLQESKFAAQRSLAGIFSDNVLMPLKASSCFPNSQMINSILRGEAGDNERFRKTLILLVFYSFWAKKAIKSNTINFKADINDADRCLYIIDKYLVDAGYPTMYCGNPYDWIFMWALCDDNPLRAFRGYMLEVIIANVEQKD